MAAEGARDMDKNLYNAARWETNIPNGVAANELYLYLTHGDRNNALHIAAQHGNTDFIRSALSEARPEHLYRFLCQGNSRGETPLHLAAEFGYMEAFKALLLHHDHAAPELEPFVNQRKPCWIVKNTKGDTPLHKALRNGYEEIAISLLGKDLALVCVCNEAGESPAYLAADASCNRILAMIPDVVINNEHRNRFSGPFGDTIFHAVRSCNGNNMRMLINDNGALLRERSKNGMTSIHYLVEKNRLAAVYTLLSVDSSLGYLQDNDGLTPLLVASCNGLFPMIMTILELCPQSVDIRDNKGKTVLHVAKIDHGIDFLSECLKNNTIKVFINQVDNYGNTPLHTALLKSEYRAAFRLLAGDGCNWRLKNNEGYSPLDLCKSSDTISYQELVYTALRYLEGGESISAINSFFFQLEVLKEVEVEQLLNKIAIAAGLLLTLSFPTVLHVPCVNFHSTGRQLFSKELFILANLGNSVTFFAAISILLGRTFGMHANKRALAEGSLLLLNVGLTATFLTYLFNLLAVNAIYTPIIIVLLYPVMCIAAIVIMYPHLLPRFIWFYMASSARVWWK